MPAPFPGMDPWLEDEEVFPDLHARLITYLSDAINAELPPNYLAITKNLVWTDDVQRREPDVSLLGREQQRSSSDSAVATLPGMLELGAAEYSEEREEPYLEILSPTGKRLVTAIEILSRSNKTVGSNGRQSYLEKQQELRLGAVNIVEIDLLRGGTHTVATPRWRYERRVTKPFSYLVSVLVAAPREHHYGVAISLDEPLPTISIPLDVGVPPVSVALQPLLDQAYDRGRYSMLVNYAQPPNPPLTPEQQSWASGVLKAKGL